MLGAVPTGPASNRAGQRTQPKKAQYERPFASCQRCSIPHRNEPYHALRQYPRGYLPTSRQNSRHRRLVRDGSRRLDRRTTCLARDWQRTPSARIAETPAERQLARGDGHAIKHRLKREGPPVASDGPKSSVAVGKQPHATLTPTISCRVSND